MVEQLNSNTNFRTQCLRCAWDDRQNPSIDDYSNTSEWSNNFGSAVQSLDKVVAVSVASVDYSNGVENILSGLNNVIQFFFEGASPHTTTVTIPQGVYTAASYATALATLFQTDFAADTPGATVTGSVTSEGKLQFVSNGIVLTDWKIYIPLAAGVNQSAAIVAGFIPGVPFNTVRNELSATISGGGDGTLTATMMPSLEGTTEFFLHLNLYYSNMVEGKSVNQVSNVALIVPVEVPYGGRKTFFPDLNGVLFVFPPPSQRILDVQVKMLDKSGQPFNQQGYPASVCLRTWSIKAE